MGYIYVIENTINGTKYVGQTTRTISDRWRGHKRDAHRIRDGKLQYIPLYKAIRKYGIDNFTISQLEECDNDMLNEREIYWIDKLDTYFNGYNATRGGDNRASHNKVRYEDALAMFIEGYSQRDIAKHFGVSSGSIHTLIGSYKDYEQIKARQHIDVFTKLCGKPVCQYDLGGEFIAEYRSIAEASKQTAIPTQNIQSCCTGKVTKAKGFQFKYKGDAPSKVNRGYGKEISQYDMDGNFIAHYINGTEAEAKSGVSGACIRQCCRGETSHAGHFIWRYEVQGENNGTFTKIQSN